MKTIRKGSITIWLSLVMCVILALIFACLQSARESAARGFVSVCADESLFSEFARYDRILYEKYGILAVDGGFGKGGLDYAAVAKEIHDAAEQAADAQKDLFRIALKETDITDLVLATDSDAAPLKKQIKEIMTAKLGIDGIGRLTNMVNTNAPLIEQQEQGGNVDPESFREAYAQQKELAEARGSEEAASRAEGAGSAAEDNSDQTEDPENGAGKEKQELAEIPPDFRNPLDHIESIIKMGIYNTILPDPTAVSGMAVDKNTLAGARTFQEGLGTLPQTEDGAGMHFLMAAYLADFFPNFLSEADQENKGIRYQAEFAIAGKGGDADNLKSVLNRILLIRMGLNYVYLNTFDPAKKAEAEACAFIIASIMLAPEETEVIAQLVLLAWAYGESMMDLKTILAGGKEPLIKDESTWQLSLSQLAQFSSETPVTSRTGLSYKDHLTILLAMRSDRELTGAFLDLLEYNRRLIGDDPAFQIDSCFTAIGTELLLTIDGKEYSAAREYGYDNDRKV